MGKILTTAEAAKRLGLSTRRVIHLIEQGKLPATRFGKSYAIDEADLKLVEVRKAGRPKKVKEGK